MSDRVSTLYQQQVLLEGVLGALMMTSLVLVVQAAPKFEYQVMSFPKDWYFDGLVTLMSLTSLLLVFTSWGMSYVASGLTSETGAKARRFRRLMLFFNRIGLTLVLAVVSALLVPSSLVGAAATLVIGGVVLAIFDELRLGALREAHQELRQQQAQAESEQGAQA